MTKSNRANVGRIITEIKSMDLETPELVYKIVAAYIQFRPDIGYISPMCYLADLLIKHLGGKGAPEKKAFKLFVNLVHSGHFTHFFNDSYTNAVKWRVEHFDINLNNIMPRLKAHFLNLAMDSRLFIYDWWSSLFTTAFPKEVVGRVWDIFLLDGEQSLMLISLGILKYYEPELLKSNFDQIITLLKKLPEDLNAD
jgi:hypothetical protein